MTALPLPFLAFNPGPRGTRALAGAGEGSGGDPIGLLGELDRLRTLAAEANRRRRLAPADPAGSPAPARPID